MSENIQIYILAFVVRRIRSDVCEIMYSGQDTFKQRAGRAIVVGGQVMLLNVI